VKFALAAVPASQLWAKPNSNFGGVHVGINAPYSFRGMPGDADSVLKDITDLGLSFVELRSQPVEGSFGAPVDAAFARMRNPTPEQQEQQRAAMAALEKWRLSASMDQFKSFRKKWDDAGVAIEIVKFDAVDRMKDEVVAYAFQLAKNLGAKAISCEIPVSKTEWLGKLAAEHKMPVAYHGHGRQQPRSLRRPGQLGASHVVLQVQLHQPRHRPLYRRQQHVADSLH
jgi:hypothetical protein